MSEYKILNNVNFPADIKNLSNQELKTLSKELRQEMIEAVSQTGGHLGAGLGVVELTVALHHIFNTPNDKRTIGFLGIIYSNARTSNTDVEYSQIAFVVGIGDSKEWKNEQDIDASGNVVVVRQEVIKGIKVCNENGAISAGDYLTTSSKKGFYMKQSDDILRNYTAAKAVDDITFDSNGEQTGIYAIMLSG